ncbi:hypothetical protein HanOQP8_Chr02g0053121 [Helianthus annuus]|nr:hypothetical protein HanOQP8_Chr02g0053121 [Helianthus annuus]
MILTAEDDVSDDDKDGGGCYSGSSLVQQWRRVEAEVTEPMTAVAVGAPACAQ